MIRLSLLSLISLLILPAGALAQEAKDSMEVGGRQVKVPAPAGFVRCDGVNAEWDKLMSAMQTPTNRVIATYGTQADQDAIRAGTPTDYAKNFNVQVIRKMETTEFGTETFAGIREETAKEVKNASAKLMEEANKALTEGGRKISEESGVDAALSVSDSAMLGVFQEDSQSLGFTLALKVHLTTSEGTDVSKSVVACMMKPVNGRLLMFYATVPYLSEADRKEAESSVTRWADAVYAANPQVKGPAASGLFDGVGRSTLIGAIVGVVVAMVLMVKKKITG